MESTYIGLVKIGLSYIYYHDDPPLVFSLGRIRKNRDGVFAEIAVEHHGECVHWGVVNVVSTQSREYFWKACKRLCETTIDWERILNTVCRELTLAERGTFVVKHVGVEDRYPASSWLIQDVIYKSEPTVFFGDGEQGKSRFALAVGLSVQTGKEIIPGFKPIETGPIVYWDWEATENRLFERVQAICKGAKIVPVEVLWVPAVGPLVDQVDEMRQFCEDNGIVLIIIDAVEAAMAGTKESGSDANDSTNKLYMGLKSIGVASLLLDHVNKVDSDSNKARKQYGSVHKRNLARTQFEIRADRVDGDPFSKKLAVFNTKKNDGNRLPDIALKVSWDEAQTETIYTKSTLTGNLVKRLSTEDAILLTLINSKIMLKASEIAVMIETKTATVSTELTRLQAEQKVFNKRPYWGIIGKSYEERKM